MQQLLAGFIHRWLEFYQAFIEWQSLIFLIEHDSLCYQHNRLDQFWYGRFHFYPNNSGFYYFPYTRVCK